MPAKQAAFDFAPPVKEPRPTTEPGPGEPITIGHFMALPLQTRKELSARWKGLKRDEYARAVEADTREAIRRNLRGG